MFNVNKKNIYLLLSVVIYTVFTRKMDFQEKSNMIKKKRQLVNETEMLLNLFLTLFPYGSYKSYFFS